RGREPVAAVEEMRQDIEVQVARNYFIYDRRRDDEPRSASVGISYLSDKRETAMAVVHELGQAVLDAQARQRNDRVTAEKKVLDAERARAEANVHDVQTELDELVRAGVRAHGPKFITNRALIAGAQQRLQSAIARVRQLETRDADLDLAAAVEDQRLGLA